MKNVALLQESGKNSSQSGLPGLTLEEKQRASEEIANIRYSQLPFLSESPNIILVNISGYTVIIIYNFLSKRKCNKLN